jgi:hypothetical protein
MFVVKHYLISHSQLAYQTDFPDSPTYFNKTILWYRLYKWEVFQSIFSEESEEKIPESLLQSAQKSLRKLVQQSGLSYGSVHKASKVCKFHLHCIQINARTDRTDKAVWLQYYRWVWNLIQVSVAVLDKSYFTGGAWFYISGYACSLCSQVEIKQSAENPYIFQGQILHSL